MELLWFIFFYSPKKIKFKLYILHRLILRRKRTAISIIACFANANMTCIMLYFILLLYFLFIFMEQQWSYQISLSAFVKIPRLQLEAIFFFIILNEITFWATKKRLIFNWSASDRFIFQELQLRMTRFG